MRMASTALAMGMTLATAFVLYSESTATRQLAAEVRHQEQAREQLAGEIAALRARRAELASPARIEGAARAIGMRPGDAATRVELADMVATASPTVGAAESGADAASVSGW